MELLQKYINLLQILPYLLQILVKLLQILPYLLPAVNPYFYHWSIFHSF